jgi:hypothetical protein
MRFNKAILFHSVILFIPNPLFLSEDILDPKPLLAPVVLISELDQRNDFIICSIFLITYPGKRKRDAQ